MADQDSFDDSWPGSPARFESSAPYERPETGTTIGRPVGLNDNQPNNRSSFAESAIGALNIANRQTQLLKLEDYVRHHLFDRQVRRVDLVRVLRFNKW